MPLLSFDELVRLADDAGSPVPVAAAGGDDPTVLEALAEACERGWVEPIVSGKETAIRAEAERAGVDLRQFRIVASDQPAHAAVAEVRAGRAKLLMKGQIATPELMRAVLDSQHGLRTGKTIAQVVLMEIEGQRRFLLADTGVTIAPTLAQKADLVEHVTEVGRALGADPVCVALMAATEKVTEAMPDTLESAELVRQAAEGRFPGAVVDGPLSFDLAYAADAGEKKRVAGSVVGSAVAMVFPNLLAANLTVKAIMYTARCRFGGVLRGTHCPVVFMSRADSTATRLNSLALALRIVGQRT